MKLKLDSQSGETVVTGEHSTQENGAVDVVENLGVNAPDLLIQFKADGYDYVFNMSDGSTPGISFCVNGQQRTYITKYMSWPEFHALLQRLAAEREDEIEREMGYLR